MKAPPGHFAQRCVERGIHSVAPNALRAEIEAAVLACMAGTGNGDFVEHVMDLRDDTAIWRFRVQEGVFYAIVGTVPRINTRTVITQDMLAGYKAQRKRHISTRDFKLMRDMGLSVKASKRRDFRKVKRAAKGPST